MSNKNIGVPVWVLKQFDRMASVFVLVSDYTKGTLLYTSPSATKITGYPVEYFLEKE